MSWLFPQIAGSIFATNMGAPTLVGLAGSAADTGFAPIMFEWHVRKTRASKCILTPRQCVHVYHRQYTHVTSASFSTFQDYNCRVLTCTHYVTSVIDAHYVAFVVFTGDVHAGVSRLDLRTHLHGFRRKSSARA